VTLDTQLLYGRLLGKEHISAFDLATAGASFIAGEASSSIPKFNWSIDDVKGYGGGSTNLPLMNYSRVIIIKSGEVVLAAR